MTKERLLSIVLAALVLGGCDEAFERARRLLDVDTSGSAPTAPTVPLLDETGALQAGAPRAAFELPVEAGVTLTIHLHSDAFDPVLDVTTPGAGSLSNDDFEGSRTDSELSVSTTTAGTLKVVASALPAAATGPFHLVVTTAGQPAAGGSLLTVGADEQDALGPGDATLGDGRWVKRYLVQVESAPLTLSIAATTMTVPNALVVDPSGHTMPPAQTGAYVLAQRGPYQVQLMSPGAGQPAGFRMSLAQQAGGDAGTPTDSRTHHALPALGADRPIAIGAQVNGDLGAGGRLPTGEPSDVYALELPDHSPPLAIFLSAADFDAYLVLLAPDGSVLEDDDGGGGTDASLAFTPTVAGRYRLVATSYRADMRGRYMLKVGTTSRDGATTQPARSRGAEQTHEGELAAGDAQLQSGEYADDFPLTLAPGQTVHLRAHSDAFDTYLIVHPPSGAQVDNDDGAQGDTDAALDFTARAAGEHRVQVTSYRPFETGHYTLTVSGAQGGSEDAGNAPAPSVPSPTSPSGRPAVRGELAAGDTQLRTGEFTDPFTRQFEVGRPVSLRLTSSDFDPYLLVTTPSGQQLDNDDLRADTHDAGIDIAAAERGDYRIVVTSYRPGETGRYELSINGGSAGPGALAAPSTPSSAARAGGPRVFGVFAGISDYPGGMNDLPECANDARKLAETLEHRGILSADRRILLTDSQATRGAMRSALTRAARELGPEDLFVFFWSGHGNRTGGSSDRREIDGMDESIVLYDGELMDDELGRLFDALHSRVAIIALDSCYSGGFAKDVVTRPGVVGLFSSEEDVLSSVAGQFQAGGYLSHFLRTGMGGEADTAPRDGTLSLGELTHYMHQQFAQHAADVRLAGAYQELVVDRGAVRVDETLWRYP